MSHEHVYSEYVGTDPSTDKIKVRCTCGDEIEFPRLAMNRVVAHSAYGAGPVVAEPIDSRMADPEWTMDETE